MRNAEAMDNPGVNYKGVIGKSAHVTIANFEGYGNGSDFGTEMRYLWPFNFFYKHTQKIRETLKSDFKGENFHAIYFLYFKNIGKIFDVITS